MENGDPIIRMRDEEVKPYKLFKELCYFYADKSLIIARDSK